MGAPAVIERAGAGLVFEQLAAKQTIPKAASNERFMADLPDYCVVTENLSPPRTGGFVTGTIARRPAASARDWRNRANRTVP